MLLVGQQELHPVCKKASSIRNAWQSPAVARQAQRMQAGEDAPPQQSNRRICCLREVMCNEGIPFRPYRGVLWVHSTFLSLVTLTFDF